MAWGKSRTATFYDKEILKYPTGLEATRNVVIASGGLSANADGRVIVEAGTLLVAASAVSGEDEVQTVTIPVGADGGTFKLAVTVDNERAVTGDMAYNIDDDGATDSMQAALAALPNVGAGNVTVAKTTPSDVVYTITFTERLGDRNIAAVEVVDNAVTDGGVAQTLTVATSNEGVTAVATSLVVPAATSGVTAAAMVGILTHTVEFFYPVESGVTDEPAAVYFHGCIFDTSKLVNVSGNLTNVKTAFPTCRFE